MKAVGEFGDPHGRSGTHEVAPIRTVSPSSLYWTNGPPLSPEQAPPLPSTGPAHRNEGCIGDNPRPFIIASQTSYGISGSSEVYDKIDKLFSKINKFR